MRGKMCPYSGKKRIVISMNNQMQACIMDGKITSYMILLLEL